VIVELGQAGVHRTQNNADVSRRHHGRRSGVGEARGVEAGIVLGQLAKRASARGLALDPEPQRRAGCSGCRI
jgi:hypothetical protein